MTFPWRDHITDEEIAAVMYRLHLYHRHLEDVLTAWPDDSSQPCGVKAAAQFLQRTKRYAAWEDVTSALQGGRDE